MDEEFDQEDNEEGKGLDDDTDDEDDEKKDGDELEDSYNSHGEESF